VEQSAEACAAASDGGGGGARDAALVLQLCLRLQLNAMMLTMGAVVLDHKLPDGTGSPTGQAPRGPTTGSVSLPAVPQRWRSWLEEDVDFACQLAAGVVATGSSLPRALVAGFRPEGATSVMDGVAASYEAIGALLDDLQASDPEDGATSTACAAVAARKHLRDRLVLLRGMRQDQTEPLSSAASGTFQLGELGE
jgi:hypothetical protein